MRIPWRSSVAVFVLVVATLSSTWAAQAYWTTAASSSGGVTATAAKIEVSAAQANTAPLSSTYQFTTATAATDNLKIAALAFSNTGTAPAALTISTSNTDGVVAAKIKLFLWASTPCGTAVPGSGFTDGTLASPPAVPASIASVGAGQSVTLCAATSLTPTVAQAQGETTTTTLTLTGRVGTNWVSTSAAPPFTQKVFKVGSTGTITCTNDTNGLLGSAILAWAKVDSATGYAIRKDSATGTVLRTVAQPTGAGPVTDKVTPGDLGLAAIGSSVVFYVTAVDATYGTSPVTSSAYTVKASLLGTLLSARCST